MKRSLWFLLSLALLTGCAPVISSQYMNKATETDFERVRENPDTYVNDIFILGGTIASTEDTQEGTEIEVVQHPINRYGEITDRDVSQGRFILVTSKQLDPLIYRRGRLITVAAQLTGARTKQLNEKEYRYPVLEAKEIYLWKRERRAPYMYDPYFYPFYYYNYPFYWNDPYFRGPFIYPGP